MLRQLRTYRQTRLILPIIQEISILGIMIIVLSGAKYPEVIKKAAFCDGYHRSLVGWNNKFRAKQRPNSP